MIDALEYSPRQTVQSVWVFKLDVPEDAIGIWNRPEPGPANGKPPHWPLRDALGVLALDAKGVEVFTAADITEYGLARYLTEANGFADGMVSRDANLLNGLRGPVVLVHSRALGEQAQSLTPVRPLSFIGRYDTRPEVVLSETIETDSAKGHLSPKVPTTDAPGMPVWPFLLMAGIALGLVAVLALPKL